MGYSIHTPCKTKKDRDEMFAFLKKHYRPFSVLAAGSGCLSELAEEIHLNDRTWAHTDDLRGPLRSDMSYGSSFSKWYIGFDLHSSAGGQGTWVKDFCRWVATKVGKLHQFKEIEGPVPYIVYDIPDDDWDSFDGVWPVLERSEYSVTKDMRQYVVDRGFRGWVPQVRSMREHSANVSENRAKREGWSRRQLEWHKERRNQFWDLQMKIARRADKYIRAELRRLDELWENR